MGHPGVAEELGGDAILLEFLADDFVNASVEGIEANECTDYVEDDVFGGHLNVASLEKDLVLEFVLGKVAGCVDRLFLDVPLLLC